MTDQQTLELKKIMNMHSFLTMCAWTTLYAKLPGIFNDEQQEFIKEMADQSVKMYERIDEFIEQILTDQVGLSLMQAGMSPMIERFLE